MTAHWKNFFENYRRKEAVTDADLFYQVGKTVDGKQIPDNLFKLGVDRIKAALDLSPNDHLFEYCCGNGLVTCELAPCVKKVTAIDFVERHIINARTLKARNNITYLVGDAKAPLDRSLPDAEVPDKFLMNVALAYFLPAELQQILANIKSRVGDNPFRFLMTDIPNFQSKWNFYNTPERVTRHQENEKQAGNTNDGMGRWWQAGEIRGIVSRFNWKVEIVDQPPELSDYRMDALILSLP